MANGFESLATLLPAKGANLQPVTREPLDATVEFLDPTGTFKTLKFNLAEHDGRVGISKHIIWAMNNSVELRIVRKS